MSDRYHLVIAGQKAGPFSEAEVRQKLESGVVDRSSLAWRPGLSTWFPLAEVISGLDVPPGGPPPVIAPASGPPSRPPAGFTAPPRAVPFHEAEEKNAPREQRSLLGKVALISAALTLLAWFGLVLYSTVSQVEGEMAPRDTQIFMGIISLSLLAANCFFAIIGIFALCVASRKRLGAIGLSLHLLQLFGIFLITLAGLFLG